MQEVLRETCLNYRISPWCTRTGLLATALHPRLCNTSRKKWRLQRFSKTRNKWDNWIQAIPTRHMTVFPVTVVLLGLHSHPEGPRAEDSERLNSRKLEARSRKGELNDAPWSKDRNGRTCRTSVTNPTVNTPWLLGEGKCQQGYIFYDVSHCENVPCVHVSPEHQHINNIVSFLLLFPKR